MYRRAARLLGAVTGLAAMAVATACTPGAQSTQNPTTRTPRAVVSTDPAKAGKVTLTVWDQEVRGSQNTAMTQLNKEFHEKYPNVTIKRVSKSFADLMTTLKLGVSTGHHPPDVVENNQGYGMMGILVNAGILLPLNEYADAYHWDKRYSGTMIGLNSFTPDGNTFGKGHLYGLSQTGEIVGMYYSKKKLKQLGIPLPKTWGEFVADLPKIRAKGTLPVSFGNKGDDNYNAIHLFGVIQARTDTKQDIIDTVFTKPGKKWDTPTTRRAAGTLQDWAKKDYISPGANGLSYNQAASDFAHGKSAFFITGTWETADLAKVMGNDLGFMPPPPAKAGQTPYTTGGEGLPWSITSRSMNPDVAAAYVNFINTPHAADVVLKAGGLPAVVPATAKPPAGTAIDQIFTSWKQLSAANGFVPYLDYSTPNFYDTITVQLQKLIGQQSSPGQCVAEMQKDYGDFQAHKD